MILPLAKLSRDMRNLLSIPEQMFSDSFYSHLNGFGPNLDLLESENDVVLKFDIPGMKNEDINISLSGSILTISGEKKQEHEIIGEKRDFRICERTYGSFTRSVQLPSQVDSDNIDATYKDGVLTVTVKKTKSSNNRKIEVKTS